MSQLSLEGLGSTGPLRSESEAASTTPEEAFRLQTERLNRLSYCNRRAAWRTKGGFACRHGVLFEHAQGGLCACMARKTAGKEWSLARWMPQIDHELKAIVMVPFAASELDSYGPSSNAWIMFSILPDIADGIMLDLVRLVGKASAFANNERRWRHRAAGRRNLAQRRPLNRLSVYVYF